MPVFPVLMPPRVVLSERRGAVRERWVLRGFPVVIAVSVLIGSLLVVAACAPAAPAPAAPKPAAPVAAPEKPAAAAPAKPAAQPAKPAPEPAKPAAQPAKPAAQPAKPAAEGEKQRPLADGFPNQPIRMLAHLPPGSDTDAFLRALAEATQPFSPVPLVVQTVADPKGIFGHLRYMEGQAGGKDGYYVAYNSMANVLRAFLVDTKPYTLDDIQHVLGGNTLPYLVAVKKDAPWKTLKDLLDEARRNPGKLRVAVGGPATSADYVFGTWIAKEAGVKLTIIPTQGAGQSVQMLLGDGSEAVATSIGGATGQLRAGELRGLAVNEPQRLRAFPDIPTLKEQGLNITWSHFQGLGAVRQVPRERAEWLGQLFKRGVDAPAFAKFVEARGLELRYLSSQQAKAAFDEMTPKFEQLLKEIQR